MSELETSFFLSCRKKRGFKEVASKSKKTRYIDASDKITSDETIASVAGMDLPSCSVFDPLNLPSSPQGDFSVESHSSPVISATNESSLTSDAFQLDVDTYGRVKRVGRSNIEDAKVLATSPTSTASVAIEHAFENEQHIVSLEGLGLTSIPSSIEDLSKLVVTDVQGIHPPQLEIYLSNNSLQSISYELFHVENLQVLSLRANKLTHLPGNVGKLKNLKYLHMGNNQLEWLPHNILQLDRLETLSVRPNPLVEVQESNDSPWKVPDDGFDKRLRYTTRLHRNGYSPQASDVPSLYELALRTIASYAVSKSEIKSWKMTTAHSVRASYKKALVQGTNGETCGCCEQILIYPVAECMEWWDIADAKLVPIKRFFCSGRCAQIWMSPFAIIFTDVRDQSLATHEFSSQTID